MSTLGLESNKGLVDVLENPSIDLSDVMIRTNVEKLSILPAGMSFDLSTELLASHRMSAVVSDIAQRYHDRIVIFDAPPILATSEPSALAMHVGQIIVVVEAERTPKAAVKEALDMMQTGARVGVVLNRCSPRVGYAQFGSYYNYET
jgi:protein-tyrosine kinase